MQSAVITKANPDSHAMRDSLRDYVEPKVHQDLLNAAFRQILVTGTIQRHPPATIATFERKQMLDFHRPTASQLNSSTIQVNCFPCRNLVIHYASLIATYLELQRRDPEIVRMDLPDPLQTAEYLHKTNLLSIGDADIAIIGDIYHLPGLWRGQWQGADGTEHDIFRWNKFRTLKGKTVVLVGCVEKIWGDAGYQLIHTVYKRSRIQGVIYIGKAGCLFKDYAPNEWIATGKQAFINDESIVFQSPLNTATETSKMVAHGAIVTVQTPLCETNEWVQQWSSKALWVDCEVGYFAKAANELKIEFGFLHVVSDNLCQIGGEGLFNEELDIVTNKRKVLYEEIHRIIDLAIC